MASNQPAYAPAPETEPTGSWDEFPLTLVGAPAPAATAAPVTTPVPTTTAFAVGEFTATDVTSTWFEPKESAGTGVTGPADQRNRHRLPRQRTVARGSTVLGVAAIAVAGAGGVATAAATNPAPVPISLPDVPDLDLPDVTLPKPADLPGISSLVGAPSTAEPDAAPAASGVTTDPGEALRTRILQQATEQRDAAAETARAAAQKAAAEQAAREAAARKVREQAAAAKAEAEAKAKAAAEAAAKAEAERLAKLAASYLKPVASSTLTAGFGDTSSLWATTHTGQDFAAPTGTPVHAVHSGTITSAGWAGSYGYRIILTLDDGTELWFCHLSTMVVTSGHVTTGDTIGRVGATGNTTGPHLHLEVRPDGGAPIDPMPWLRDHGVTV